MILLRLAALSILILLLVNPAREERARVGPPLVLLDRSLSMGPGGLEMARRLVGATGTLLTFGDAVEPLDSAAAPYGASRIAPALVRAAAWDGPVVVVTDGEVDDLMEVAPELLSRVGVTLVPRDTVPSAAILDVHLPPRVGDRDTVRLRVVLAAWGEGLQGRATVTVSGESGPIASGSVELPAPGATMRHEIAFPAARLRAGAQALTVRLDAGAADRESRDDRRLRVITKSPEPQVVVLAAPADWEARFLASTLRHVLEAPARVLVQARPGEWRDAATLASVGPGEVRDAARRAAVVVWRAPQGTDPPALPERGGLLRWPWPRTGGEDGWYVSPPPPSVLAGALAGVRWDSLPPLAAPVAVDPMEGSWVALTARRARRGDDRPVLVARDSGGRREIILAASGLWTWAFRGGPDAQAYRTVVSAATDWLLGDRAVAGDAVRPVRSAVPLATPLAFARRDTTLRTAAITLTGPQGTLRDTLRFDVAGVATLSLAPGIYRYAVDRGAGSGVVAVEPYSDELRPRPVLLAERATHAARATVARTARGHGWLFAVALALLIAEWAWRRRRGLP